MKRWIACLALGASLFLASPATVLAETVVIDRGYEVEVIDTTTDGETTYIERRVFDRRGLSLHFVEIFVPEEESQMIVFVDLDGILG